MRLSVVLGIAASVFAVLASPLRAAITYVDATIANTTLNGTALVQGGNHTAGESDGAMDNQWHSRGAAGNGGSVWTADELNSGVEDVLPLVTTVTFPNAGAYRLFAYAWDSEETGADWDVRFRIGGVGIYSKVQASEVSVAQGNRISNAVVVSEGSRKLIEIPIGVVTVAHGEAARVYIDDDATSDSRRTWYDGVGYERVFTSTNERVIAVDFNKSNAPGAPAQAMFRSVRGSSTTSQNSTNITKKIGTYSVQLTKSSVLPFDFRGPNGDATRIIPSGSTSLSFLVADFIGARDGTIHIGVSNLPSGRYLFRSYHLDTFNSSTLGYAQGGSSTTPNTLRAEVGGTLAAIVQPTALGPSGLGTNFISNADIPTVVLPFDADGTNAVNIQLSTVYNNGSDRFILLNGFEIFSTLP